MKNKLKLFVSLFTVAFFSVIFIACSNEDKETTYKVEMGVVSNSCYETAMSQITAYGANINYSNIKSIRGYLYENTQSDYECIKDVSIDEIRDFLINRGMTKVQANAEISVLETLGNDIVFCNYLYSNYSKVWIYATK